MGFIETWIHSGFDTKINLPKSHSIDDNCTLLNTSILDKLGLKKP